MTALRRIDDPPLVAVDEPAGWRLRLEAMEMEFRPRLNPRATGAKPHRGSTVQPNGLGNGRSPPGEKQAEIRGVSSYKN